MTSGYRSCKCSEKKKPIKERGWVVTERQSCDGKPSKLSTVFCYSCLAVCCYSCLAVWRTKAAYVRKLSNGGVH
jgi:hypothetical protein